MFGWYQNCFYLCTRFSEVKYSGCSAVRLAHLLWEQGVEGSNPFTPTRLKTADKPNNHWPRWRNGRRARFRCECREACRFDSYSGHPKSDLTK